MKNPNSPANRMKSLLAARWSSEDYPGAEPRFQMLLLAKDIAIFFALPVFSILMFKACENAGTPKKKPPAAQRASRDGGKLENSKTQIIDFRKGQGSASTAGIAKRSPGTLVKLRLLNVVETYSNVPVHAQIVDNGLGATLRGGTLIGDAVSDTNFERINISFKYARDPNRESVALPVSARALSLDGTLGLIANKKEGFFARSVIGSGGSAGQSLQSGSGSSDLKEILFKALTAGLVQEFGSSTQVEKNRAQVLTLAPNTEFFAELSDFFPGSGK